MKIYISQLIPENEYIEIIKEYDTGLELIDFSIAEFLDNSDVYKEKYQSNIYKDINLGIHGPFFDLIPATFDSLIREVTIQRFNQAYDIAKELNAKYIVFHTGYLKDIYFYESWLENSSVFWKEFLKDKDDTIQIYLENVFEDEYLPLKQLIEQVNNPSFNICLDLGHVNIRDKYTLKEWLTELKGYIKHLHIHNNNSINDEHEEINNGTINYKEIFELINELNLDVDITIETSGSQKIIDSLEYLNNIRRGCNEID